MKTIQKLLMILLISLGGCGLLNDQEIAPKNNEEIEISKAVLSTKPDQQAPTRGR